MEDDRVSIELGQSLKAFYRKAVLVTRVNGKELLITSLDTVSTDTLLFCKGLHQLIASIKINDRALSVIIVFSSRNETISFIDFSTQANNTVYKSTVYKYKEFGRNRTEVYSKD